MTTGADVGCRCPADRLDGQPQLIAAAPAGPPPWAQSFRVAAAAACRPACRPARPHQPQLICLRRRQLCQARGDEHQRAGPVRHHHGRPAAGPDLGGQRRRIARAQHRRDRRFPLLSCASACSASTPMCRPRTIAATASTTAAASRDPGQPRTGACGTARHVLAASSLPTGACQPPRPAGPSTSGGSCRILPAACMVCSRSSGRGGRPRPRQVAPPPRAARGPHPGIARTSAGAARSWPGRRPARHP